MEKLLSAIQWVIPFDVNPPEPSEGSTAVARSYTGEDAWVAAVSYIPFVSAAILLLRKDNSEFVLYHAKQAVVLIVLTLLFLAVLSSILRLVLVAILVLIMIISAYRALAGKKFYVPLVTELARWIEL